MLAFTPASTTHQRNRAVLLLVVEEERPVRKPADKVIAPVLLDNPVPSHADIVPKTRLLYQFYCINKLRPFIPPQTITIIRFVILLFAKSHNSTHQYYVAKHIL